MVSVVMSTPSGRRVRISSFVSWPTTPTPPPGPNASASAVSTNGSANSPSPPGPTPSGPESARWTTGVTAAVPSESSAAMVRLTRGDRPASPDHRANRATLPVDSRAAATTRARATAASVAVSGASTNGASSHAGVAPSRVSSAASAAGRDPEPADAEAPDGAPNPPSSISVESRVHDERSSNSANVARASSGSHPPSRSWSTCTSRGTSRIRGMTSAFILTRSRWAARFSRNFGDRSSRCSYRVSRSPYSLTSLAAVFSPTPGTPGRLSEGSPRNAASNGYLAGGTPVRSSMPASS